MEDPRPLLNLRSLDDSIEDCMSNFGWKELVQAILVSLASFFDAQQTFMSVYADALPSWHCTPNSTTTCDPSRISSICGLPKSAWAWDGPSWKTIISEWGLECSSSFLAGLPASSYFMGCVLSGLLLATLADSSLGRKNLLLLSCLTMSLSSLSIALFSDSLLLYSSLRFLSGFGRSSIGTCTLVLLTERVGRKWRARVGMMQFFLFTLGFLSLPAIAYLYRGSPWRRLYLVTSLPSLFYCVLLYLFVTESPRWLFMQGRASEAVRVLKRFATSNADKLDNLRISDVRVARPSIVELYSSMKELLVKRWALRRMLAVMVLGFGIGMVYYGMPMGVGNLGFDIYLSVVFNAALEIPSYVLTFVVLDRWNRRGSLLGFCLLSGTCGVMCALLSGNKGLQIGLEMASFFMARTAFNVLMIYTVELFPTSVRNSATSMVRQALVLGAVFSPILVSAGRRNQWLSYGVFGSAILGCGFFVACLPETRGTTLCDTMDQQERKDSLDLTTTLLVKSSLLKYPGVKAIDPAYALPVDVVNRLFFGR